MDPGPPLPHDARVPPTVLHLVDASPYLFRAYFALPESIVDARGRPANAVRGFAAFLLGYHERHRPTHIGVAFDQSLTTSFRNELFPAYKADRGLPPPELEAQIDGCRRVARALGAVEWADRRYEADDLIAAACHHLVRAGRAARAP